MIDEYVYPPPTTTTERLQSFLDKTHADIVILGHIHVPFIEVFPRGYVINPGSVGQPRSGNPNASYMILNIEKGEIKIDHHLVNYSVDAVSKKILEVGLPSFLAGRLYAGT